jgi:uncharacterized surface protein with fasciclin (FAS1) repeats
MMKHNNIRRRFSGKTCSGWLALVLLAWAAGCTRVAPVRQLTPPNNNPDTVRDVQHILDSVPGFSLFAMAAERGEVDTLLDPGTFYTLFVPTDSAMQAAGMNAQAITAMPVDSLGKWVQYHITYGNSSTAALTNTPVSAQLFGLRQDYESVGNTYYVFQYSLYVKESNVLYINGIASNTGDSPIQASNGYLYPVHRVLQAPVQTVFSIIANRPELSMYYFAIQIMDSITQAVNNGSYQPNEDSIVFSNIQYVEAAGGRNPNISPVLPTVFAPTNTAFQQAGFSSTDDIRNYALSALPGYAIINNQQVYVYDPLDSVLKSQYLYNAGQVENGATFASLLCYNDLAGYSGINNNVLNVNNFLSNPFPLQFSGSGGVLNIKWTPAQPVVSLPYDSSSSFLAVNGVIYECDQLFYPHN